MGRQLLKRIRNAGSRQHFSVSDKIAASTAGELNVRCAGSGRAAGGKGNELGGMAAAAAAAVAALNSSGEPGAASAASTASVIH